MIKQRIMRQLIIILVTGALVSITCSTYAQTIAVNRFHKVIISPYIQATFVQGDEERVTINSTNVDSNKLHIEVHGGTLRVYLDGAKDIPHNESAYGEDGKQHSYHRYPDHSVIVTVTYKKLNELSLRGSETYLCQSPLSTNSFNLRVYGDSKVIFTEVHFSQMYTTIYGDGSLDIRSGEVNSQHYTCYGDGKIDATAIAGQAAKVTAFGEAQVKVNVSQRIKITSFGEARIGYLGNPEIVKGIHFGGVNLQKID